MLTLNDVCCHSLSNNLTWTLIVTSWNTCWEIFYFFHYNDPNFLTLKLIDSSYSNSVAVLHVTWKEWQILSTINSAFKSDRHQLAAWLSFASSITSSGTQLSNWACMNSTILQLFSLISSNEWKYWHATLIARAFVHLNWHSLQFAHKWMLQ